jgi:hypothetical protein
MITFTVLVVLILVLVGVWLYDRNREPEEKVSTRATETASSTYQNLSSRVSVRIPFIGKKKDEGLQLAEWLAEKGRKPAPSAEFKAWLGDLSVDELKSYEKALSGFCDSQGFALGWLMSDDIKQDKEMNAALEAAVLNFSQAYWQASAAKDSVGAFATYQTWKANPKKGSNKAFGQKLFNLLLQKGLATAPPELFLAEEKEREDFVNQAILEVASRKPAAFNEAVKEAVAAPDVPEAEVVEDQILPVSTESDQAAA